MADVPHDYTQPATLNLQLGGSWRSEWAAEVSELGSVASAIEITRREVGRVAEAAKKVGGLPPEQRALHLDRLAKAGKVALGTIEKAREGAERILGEVQGSYNKSSRTNLASPRGDVHHGLAGAQLRDRIASAKHPAAEARKYLDDPEAVAAILGVFPAASGLTREEYEQFRTQAEHRFMPHVASARKTVTQAEDVFTTATTKAEEVIAGLAGLERTPDGWKAAWED